MKYRMRQRKHGWVVQRLDELSEEWGNITLHRWHWLASLHLWWLRERARAAKKYPERFL